MYKLKIESEIIPEFIFALENFREYNNSNKYCPNYVFSVDNIRKILFRLLDDEFRINIGKIKYYMFGWSHRYCKPLICRVADQKIYKEKLMERKYFVKHLKKVYSYKEKTY
jgi:hypothetical protein